MHTDLENKLPEMLIQRVNKTEVLVYPNAMCGPNWIHRILSALKFASPMSSSNDVDSEAQESKSAEEYLWEEIEDQKKHLKNMSGVLDQQTKLLRLIVQALQITIYTLFHPTTSLHPCIIPLPHSNPASPHHLTPLLSFVLQKMEIRSEADECDEGVSLEEIIRAPSITRRFHSSSSAVRRMPLPKKDL
ncbi:Transient receptor potential cation channel subfamily A member 1 [Portunus trituberculatus]|uniref:Transient receptor potential cation channel subfamily A member 1 n=1 Tax=Portunus trituberculatus TaxID=210409 RepID=A0A5B7E5I2_PORTR|nr:Transient receptor potential cation channel subfamily A member 1 [Portunus trituberculatus]